VIGGSVAGAGNVISGNGLQGIAISDTNTLGNRVVGNHVGVSPAGTLALSNGWSGVEIFGGAAANVIAGNLISGNGNAGVMMDGAGTGNNVVQGNYIGVNPAGNGAMGNLWAGVYLWGGAAGNLIGGPGAGNLISGNGNQGVSIGDPDTIGNVVAANIIGLNADGTAAVSNAWAGVALFNAAQANVIGGTMPGTGNVISGNGNQGVALADPNTMDNTVAANYIGLDATGSLPIGNAWAGVDVFNSAQNNLIGGGIGARNLISGNGLAGVSISGGGSGTVVQGNTIGLNNVGSPAPNLSAGVVLFNGAVSNQIGGTALGAANLIADNDSDGVQLFGPTTTYNTVRGNSITGNSGAGIALYNSANLSAASPNLVGATLTTSLAITGGLAGSPNTTYHLDFYAGPPPQSAAQARTYLGARDVVTGFGGTVNFATSLPAIVPAGQIITATATDPGGNTSALSPGVAVTATDSVGDGIPDAWRAAQFGGSGTTTNSQSCATCDPDHDGMNNLQEFLAGTDPNHAGSVLHISALTITNADVTISFQSATGIVYRVEARDDVAGGGWSLLADQLLGTGGVLQITDPGALELPKQFYRLSVEP
jgi:Right handed beta helix region